MNRRRLLRAALQACGGAVAAPMLSFRGFRRFAGSETKYSVRAIDLVLHSTVIDMLNPFSLEMVLSELVPDKPVTWMDSPDIFTPADFARLHESGGTSSTSQPTAGTTTKLSVFSSLERVHCSPWGIFHEDRLCRDVRGWCPGSTRTVGATPVYGWKSSRRRSTCSTKASRQSCVRKAP